MNKHYQILGTLIALSLSSLAHADIYKWKDAQGVTPLR